MTLLRVHVIVILLTTIIIAAAQSPSTIENLAEAFQHLLSSNQSPKNDYLRFIASVNNVASNKSKQAESLSNEEKKVLNLMTAAAVARVILKISKSSSSPILNEDPSEIQPKIDSIEHGTTTLAQYVSTETSRLESELQTKLDDATDLSRKLADLESSIKSSASNNSSSVSTLITSKSQELTLNLLQVYVCMANPIQRFRDIQQTVQINHPLLFMEIPNTSPTFNLPHACRQPLDSLQSHLNNSVSHLRTTHPEETETLRESHTILEHHNIPLSTTSVDLDQLNHLIIAVSQVESSLNTLIKDLSAHVKQPQALAELKRLHVLASFYELDDPTCTSEHLENVNVDKIESTVENLRDLRLRLYNAIKSTISQSSHQQNETDENYFDEHLVKDALAGITTSHANCVSGRPQIGPVHAKEFETQLAKLTYYRHVKQLSDLLNNLNSPQASSVEIHESNLKTLSFLTEQVIKSSLLQIEYDNGLKKQIDPPSTSIHSTRVRSYTFILSESNNCAPDNYIQPCYLINGQYPGPAIKVNQHDLLRVAVINRLPVPTTIHFHGILQKHTVSSDGVAHVTQHPIPPNATYVYEMHIGDQSGTYMYHGHVDLDLVWLHGPLIVEDNPEEWKSLGTNYAYYHEHTYILEEIFHESLEELIRGIVEEGIDDPPVTSFGINGKSYGNWSTNQGNAPGYEVLTVKPGETYRFRIINMGAGSMLHFSIQGHNLTVIEMDGVITEQVITDRLEVHTGQRYSVLVKMDKEVANYWVQAKLMGEDGGADNGRAIIHYECADDPEQLKTHVFQGTSVPVDISGDNWVLDQLMPNAEYRQKGVYDFPEKSDRQILIDMQMRTVDGPPRFLVNGNLFQKPNKTYLESVREGKNISADTHVFQIREGEVIDLVFQNRVDDTGGCDEHPMHLHGHSFWAVTSGADEVDMSTIKTQLSRESGNRRQFRDTFTLFPNSTVESETSGAPCGWTAVRFVADNPGVWLVHCHVTSHMILGKMFVLYEYNERNVKLVNE